MTEKSFFSQPLLEDIETRENKVKKYHGIIPTDNEETKTIIDYGCATSSIVGLETRPVYSNERYIGVDFYKEDEAGFGDCDLPSIASEREKVWEYKKTDDGKLNGIEDKSADEIVIKNVFGDPRTSIPEIKKIFLECQRVLKPNGEITIVEELTPHEMIKKFNLNTDIKNFQPKLIIALQSFLDGTQLNLKVSHIISDLNELSIYIDKRICKPAKESFAIKIKLKETTN